jgi:hypothetical protein
LGYTTTTSPHDVGLDVGLDVELHATAPGARVPAPIAMSRN